MTSTAADCSKRLNLPIKMNVKHNRQTDRTHREHNLSEREQVCFLLVNAGSSSQTNTVGPGLSF